MLRFLLSDKSDIGFRDILSVQDAHDHLPRCATPAGPRKTPQRTARSRLRLSGSFVRAKTLVKQSLLGGNSLVTASAQVADI